MFEKIIYLRYSKKWKTHSIGVTGEQGWRRDGAVVRALAFHPLRGICHCKFLFILFYFFLFIKSAGIDSSLFRWFILLCYFVFSVHLWTSCGSCRLCLSIKSMERTVAIANIKTISVWHKSLRKVINLPKTFSVLQNYFNYLFWALYLLKIRYVCFEY